ncbi:MAG: phosphohistidine-like domain-containing protein [bacterium]
MTEEIETGKGLRLHVEKHIAAHGIEVFLRLNPRRRCLLHWGLSRYPKAPWRIPPRTYWPEGTRQIGPDAVQTPFSLDDGEGRIHIRLPLSPDFSLIDFVLFFPEEESWDNNNGENYRIELPALKVPSSPSNVLKGEIAQKTVMFEHLYRFENGLLAGAVTREEDVLRVTLVTNVPGPLILHWGVTRQNRRDEWSLPAPSIRPPGTIVFQRSAARTPFSEREGINRIRLEFGRTHAPQGISFLLWQPDTGYWIRNNGRNFSMPLRDISYQSSWGASPLLSGIAAEIIHAETRSGSWSLMHRYNLAFDLLERVGEDIEGLALLYGWLRLSAIRQLTWQRHYNTQPRELSHALDRLTLRLADNFRKGGEKLREWIRLIMTTLGRGGEGQRIRDEFLNIMHRHRIKEVAGNFLEEWHQKLHNNATPDDIVISEAYLDFLRSGGDLDLFYATLEEGGVGRSRLGGFERPILTEPEFYPDIQEALIDDFERYLKILKSVYSATDLENAMESAEPHLDKRTNAQLRFIWRHRDTAAASLTDLLSRITMVRTHINESLHTGESPEQIRDLLFLDLSLEGLLRSAAERNLHHNFDRSQLVEIIGLVLTNMILTRDDEEIAACCRHWDRLMEDRRLDREWSLQAASVLERLERALGAFIDALSQHIQPVAESLGDALRAESWSITLFSEEVVRGGLAFILSQFVRHLTPVLRTLAELGNWQIISPGSGEGTVMVVDRLRSIQGRVFSTPTVVVARGITGEEEIPEGINALLTAETVDCVSHIAIRARNTGLLFAACYDKDTMDRIAALEGQYIRLTSSASGEVLMAEGQGKKRKAEQASPRMRRTLLTRPNMSLQVDTRARPVGLEYFRREVVGGKSFNLKRLADALPAWIHIPASVALPFGTFDMVLSDRKNHVIAQRYADLTGRIGRHPAKTLQEVRSCLMLLEQPEGFMPSLKGTMEEAGLRFRGDWNHIWECIKRVWASKWNERAYLSRRAWGLRHRDLFMAVLIQEVVKADYAFVIHTASPFTGNRHELYAEVVVGLGETLVGNHPGRALGFVSNKGHPEPQVLSYPSKGTGIFGAGLIFRSDSNAEDLAGYAGAGLYDSILSRPSRRVVLDYSHEPLVQDENFRRDLLLGITRTGIETEHALGLPQDIEGAYARGECFVVQARPQVGLTEWKDERDR